VDVESMEEDILLKSLDLALFQPNYNTWWVLKHISYATILSLSKREFGEMELCMFYEPAIWTCNMQARVNQQPP
jgi:hypothetical protein